jgi:glycosyltransferase involved in cell wall biosynthesis
MNYLFIHQNMPGQFGHLAARLARDPQNRVAFLTKSERPAPAGVTPIRYRLTRGAHASTHHYIRDFETAVLHGQAAARACLDAKNSGFTPDIVVAHPGWGEPMYIKDVHPGAKLVNYCEFFYRTSGADIGFLKEDVVDVDLAARVRTRNAALMITLEACDRGFSPTKWQRSVHPAEWREKIDVIFDGIDTDRAQPDPQASFRLPDGTLLTRRDQIITYVARDLEPYRGFPSFMRAVPRISAELPDAYILIVGRDGISYGQRPKTAETWRQAMLDEIGPVAPRVNFLGRLAYADYLRLLQISSAHIYLTVPFVLSWSVMEALAAGCIVVGSRTAPVEEVIRDGENGLLVDFFSPDEIARTAIDAVRRNDALADMRRKARDSILGRYDLATCLPRQLSFLRGIAVGDSMSLARASA